MKRKNNSNIWFESKCNAENQESCDFFEKKKKDDEHCKFYGKESKSCFSLLARNDLIMSKAHQIVRKVERIKKIGTIQ